MDKVSKIAVITGSTAGIGLGIAHSLAAKGCGIVLHGSRGADLTLEVTEDMKKKYSVDVNYIQADLSKRAGMEHLCMRVTEMYPAGVDILVNNAGFQYISPVDEFPMDKWDDMLAVMLTAPFHLIKSVLPGMKQKRWGRIINISSACGLRAFPNKAPYITCKHGLNGLTKAVGLENAPFGITCNAICPGWVDTKIFQGQVQTFADKEGLPYEEAKHKFLSQRLPTGKAVEIQEIASMVCFLCSEDAANMTGSNMVVDGGITI